MSDGAPRGREAGFTLVELMISLVVFSLVVAGVLAVAVSMTQGFREQRQAIEAETATRIPLDFIADALRQASPGVADPAKVTDTVTCTAGALTVTNNSGAPDTLDVIFASGAVVVSSQAVFSSSSTSLSVSDASQLSANDYVLVTDGTQGALVKIASISGSTLTTNTVSGCTTAFPSGGYAAGSLVIRAQHATFTVGTQDGYPTLFMDPDAGGSAAAEPLADNVEDFQVALGVDRDADGAVGSDVGTAGNDDDWYYNNASDSTYAASGSPPTNPIRAVRVTLVARTSQALIGSVTPYARPAIEDHTAGGADAYRRRVLRTIVEFRNLSESP